MGLSFEGVVEEELLLCMVSPPPTGPPIPTVLPANRLTVTLFSRLCACGEGRSKLKKRRCDLWMMTVEVGFLSLSWNA